MGVGGPNGLESFMQYSIPNGPMRPISKIWSPSTGALLWPKKEGESKTCEIAHSCIYIKLLNNAWYQRCDCRRLILNRVGQHKCKNSLSITYFLCQHNSKLTCYVRKSMQGYLHQLIHQTLVTLTLSLQIGVVLLLPLIENQGFAPTLPSLLWAIIAMPCLKDCNSLSRTRFPRNST